MQQQDLQRRVQRASHYLQVAYDQWQLTRDELTAFNHAQAVERARTEPPPRRQAPTEDIAAVAVFVHDGLRNLRDEHAQHEASLRLGSSTALAASAG